MTDSAATRRRLRRRWAAGVAVAVVAAVVATSSVLIAQRATAAAPALTAAVVRGDVTRSVSGTGSLVDELTYAVAADGTATLVARAGTSIAGGATSGQGASSSSSSSSGASASGSASGTATTDSVAVAPGDRVERGRRIARITGADGRVRDVDSPIAGRIRTVTAAPRAAAGQLVTVGTGRVVAALSISENQIAQVRRDQRVALSLAAGTASASGTVAAVEQVPDATSGVLRYTVLVRPDRLPPGARIGMSVTGAITTARVAAAAAVPAAAIQVHGDALRVEVQQAGSTRVVPVRIDLVGDAAVQVVSGLHAGQRVVIGAAGTIAATTRRLGPPASVAGSNPSASPSSSAAR